MRVEIGINRMNVELEGLLRVCCEKENAKYQGAR
jgi:hypothetical protein